MLKVKKDESLISTKQLYRVTWSLMDPLKFKSKFIQYGNYVRGNKYGYVFINFNAIQIYVFDYVNIHCFFIKAGKRCMGQQVPKPIGKCMSEPP